MDGKVVSKQDMGFRNASLPVGVHILLDRFEYLREWNILFFLSAI